MKNIVYDYYSKDLSVKVKTAKYQKMKQGQYLGGHVPYGLMKNPADKHKLMVDPEAAAIVREIFEMAIAGMRLIDMARTLNERGVETPSAYYRRKHPKSKKFANTSVKSCWNHNCLRNILKQEMYYGAVVGHKRQGIGVGCRHTTAVPKAEQFIVEGKHDGIVTKEEFEKAQGIFYTRAETKKKQDVNYPLHRKVRCGVCGRAMQHKSYMFRQIKYSYFGCQHSTEQVGENRCSKRYTLEDDLNAVVWSAVRKILDMTDAIEQRLEESQGQSRQEGYLLAERIAGLEKEKEKCESDKFVNVDLFMAGDLQKDIYLARRSELTRFAERIEAEMLDAKKKLHEMETAADDEMEAALGTMKRFAGEEQLSKAMVQELIEKVLVTDPEHVEIVWKFSDEVRKFIGV
jgi:hypothetical protein